jgi:hypothetical protein
VLRSPEAAAGLLAALLGTLHLVLLPTSGTDLAAQVARASFARAYPLTPVDLSWYSGTHPFAYSLLSPAVMAVVGVGLSGLLAAVAAAALLAHLLRRTPHVWPGALAGSVFSVVDVVDGRTTFALGAVAALAAVIVLPRRGPAAACAVITALLSPVAAAFLGLAAAVLVLHRRRGGWTLGMTAAAPVAVLAVLFPTGGEQPYRPSSAAPAVLAGLVLALLTTTPLLRTGGLLYAGAVALLLLTHDPFGSNILRLGLLLAAPLVLATVSRTRLVVVPIAAALATWQLRPAYADVRARPAPGFLALDRALVRLDARRVEVVPLRDHQEAEVVARAVPLARGWSRQIDRGENALFYEGVLTPERFHAWVLLHRVDAVALADAPLDTGGRREATLLRHQPVRGLEREWYDAHWTVWRVVDARPLAAPPAVVVTSGRASLVLRSGRAVDSLVDVRWSRWLSLSGPGCLLRTGDRTRVRFARAGTVTVTSALLPRGHC